MGAEAAPVHLYWGEGKPGGLEGSFPQNHCGHSWTHPSELQKGPRAQGTGAAQGLCWSCSLAA